MISINGHQSTTRLRAFTWMEASDSWGLQEHSQIRTVCKGVAGFITGNVFLQRIDQLPIYRIFYDGVPSAEYNGDITENNDDDDQYSGNEGFHCYLVTWT